MFNFKELKLDKQSDLSNLSSFVGIRRNEYGELEFRLPKGFDNFPENDFNATKQLFFRLYRTFKKFEQEQTKLKLDEKPMRKDNIEKMGYAYHFKDNEENDVILYSKISVIENLLETYQELALNVIERHIGRSEFINYTKLDQYLDKAIYLANDVIYVEEMDIHRYTIKYQPNTLIDLFCFILYELQNELEQQQDIRVAELANNFKEQFLSPEQSLFNEYNFESTIATLKDILNDIDRVTGYKDEDYWRLFEAIESFLYGELDMENTHENGIFWGINNFYQIWEDMCNTFAFLNFNVIYADTNIIIKGKRVGNSDFGGHRIFKKQDFENSFFINFRNEKRWMRPDLIHDNLDNRKFIDKNISIKIDRRDAGRIDVTIDPVNKNDKKLYRRFCNLLEEPIRRDPRVRVARKVGKNFFKNYSEAVLEEQIKNLQKSVQLKDKGIQIIDWKYMNSSDFLQKTKRLDDDISKQICYEFCLQESSTSYERDILIKSHFVIPYYFEEVDNIGESINETSLYSRINENNIEVFRANFNLIQHFYLDND